MVVVSLVVIVIRVFKLFYFDLFVMILFSGWLLFCVLIRVFLILVKDFRVLCIIFVLFVIFVW